MVFENSEHKVLFKNDWIQVRESKDKFFFLRRKGKNSVAVLLYRDGEVLARYQPMCAVEVEGESTNRLAPCPITGSVEENDSYLNTAIREAKEEAGYDISSRIESTGSYIVSTQCDEICYTFIADVSSLVPEEAKGDGGYHESISYNKWVKVEDVPKLENVYGGLLILVNQVLAKRSLSESIDPNKSFSDIVSELLHTYKKSGKIGSTKPKDLNAARKEAIAIAYKVKDKKYTTN